MPGAKQREREAKFQVAPEHLSLLQPPSLSIEGYTFRPLGLLVQTDFYLDTPAYAFLRHGLALRVRGNDGSYEVGIKSLHSKSKSLIQDRLDLSIPLPAHAKPFEVDAWPATFVEFLETLDIKRHIKLDSIRPLVVVRQSRQKAHIVPEATGKPIAEWSLDEVWINGQGQENGPHYAHFHELEIESLGPNDDPEGNPQQEVAFAELVAHVQERFALIPVFTSKFVRGLEATLVHAHHGMCMLTPEMELAAGCRLLLHQQLSQILYNEAGVRQGKKAKYVHDIRVAIRRARAIILLCGDHLPAQSLEPYAKGLKRLGRALGAVRDLDVALHNLHAFQRRHTAVEQTGIKALRSELKKSRTHAHITLLTLLNSKNHRKFIIKFHKLCTTTEPEPATSQTTWQPPGEFCTLSQVRHTMPTIILSVFQAVRAFELAFAGSELPSVETFHALRIQGKSLRYLLEFTQHLLGASAPGLIAQLAELQEHLGDLNDAHTEEGRLRLWAEMVHEDNALRGDKSALAPGYSRNQSTSHHLPPRFASFISLPNRQRLATAIAHL